MKKRREKRGEEVPPLPFLMSSIPRQISSRHEERNKTMPSLCSMFSTCLAAGHVQIPVKKSWRDKKNADRRGRKGQRDKQQKGKETGKRQRE